MLLQRIDRNVLYDVVIPAIKHVDYIHEYFKSKNYNCSSMHIGDIQMYRPQYLDLFVGDMQDLSNFGLDVFLRGFETIDRLDFITDDELEEAKNTFSSIGTEPYYLEEFEWANWCIKDEKLKYYLEQCALKNIQIESTPLYKQLQGYSDHFTSDMRGVDYYFHFELSKDSTSYYQLFIHHNDEGVVFNLELLKFAREMHKILEDTYRERIN